MVSLQFFFQAAKQMSTRPSIIKRSAYNQSVTTQWGFDYDEYYTQYTHDPISAFKAVVEKCDCLSDLSPQFL